MRLFTSICVLVLSVILPAITHGQILKTTSLNLNSGGVIHDVAYDSYHDAYVVVGKFTSINGLPRTNLAFIDATNFTVTNEIPVTAINGEIRTVEVIQVKPIGFDPAFSYIYLGGNFTSITVGGTAHTREYLCRLRAIKNPVPTSYFMNGWTAGMLDQGNGFSVGVNELHLSSDTLVAVGQFYADYSLADYFYNVIAYDANLNATNTNLSAMFMPPGSELINSTLFHGIERLNNKYYLYGQTGTSGFSKRYNLQGALDPTFLNDVCVNNNNEKWQMKTHQDANASFLIFFEKYAGGSSTVVRDLNGTVLNAPFCYNIPTIFPGFPSLLAVDTYKNLVLGGTTLNLYSYRTNGTSTSTQEQSFTLTNNWWFNATAEIGDAKGYQAIHVSNDKLFLSGSQLATVNGTGRTGLAVFCMEPFDAGAFTNSDALVCSEQIQTYTIPVAKYATGYKWTYTGTGAQYRIAGTLNAFQPLTNNHIEDLAARSLDVYFPNGTTAGDLIVEPFSTCNTSVDYQYGAATTITIGFAPLPDVIMSDTLSLNCFSDTTFLTVGSLTPNSTYSMFYSGTPVANDSILITTNDPSIFSGYYYGYVTEPVEGCTNLDSTFFSIDTIAPLINQGLITTSPSSFDCNTASMTVQSNISNGTVYWEYTNDPTIPLPDPFTIYSTDSLNYTVYSTFNSNGCTASATFAVTENQTLADGMLVGHPNWLTEIIDDSISCLTPNLTLQCDVTAPFNGIATAEWLNGSAPTGSTNLTLTTADSLGMHPIFHTKTYRFLTTHSTSGCQDTNTVVVRFDLGSPFMIYHAGNESINCSQNSALIVHTQTGGNVTEGWLDPFGVQTFNDSITAMGIGDYYYEVTSNVSGCSVVDTVTVTQTMDILLNLISDTLVCPGETVTITANPVITTGEIPTFLWSNGATLSNADAIGGSTNELSVIVQTTSGCIGYDTTTISITAPIVAQISSSTGCSSAVIQIDNVTGGSGNYTYSIDQQNWQTSPSFTELLIGTYTVSIQDDLGCVYDFVETIDPNVGGLDVNFLVSTYNEEGDTIAFVNISGFSGFDSLEWIVPVGATITSSDDSMLVLSIGVEGWYNVTLVGHLDTCSYSFTKTVYFGQDAPIFNEDYESLGIQNLVIYPNPTTGSFTVDLEFGVEQNYSILVTNSAGQPMLGMSATGVGTIISENFNFPFGTATGPYMIHIIGDYDATQETIILN